MKQIHLNDVEKAMENKKQNCANVIRESMHTNAVSLQLIHLEAHICL